MSLLGTPDISAMQAIAEQALPGTCVISGLTFSDDGGGGGTQAYTASGTVACRIAPLSGTEREVADRVSADADFVVTLPVSAAITTDSRFIIAGATYQVEAIRDRSWEITQRVEVVKRV